MSFQPNQLIRLTGLNNAAYNGILAKVVYVPSSEMGATGRYQVKLADDVAPPLQKHVNVKPDNMQHACTCCHKGGNKLMFCAKCRNARYCDTRCQRDDWQRHRKECNLCSLLRDSTKNPLHVAIAEENLRLVQKLVEEDGIDVNMTSNTTKRTALLTAATMSNLAIVQYLLQHGADFNKADKQGVSPLLAAAVEGKLPVIRCLVAAGADIHAVTNDGRSSIFLAAERGHLSVVQYLLEHGGDKNRTNDDDRSPLYVAAQNGHLTVVRLLMEHGADKEKVDKVGISPLIIAIGLNHTAVVRLLVEQGADVNRVARCGRGSIYGHTYPLHTAAHAGHSEIVSCLMSAGASLTVRTSDGQLPIDIAKTEEIKQLIRAEEKRRHENRK